MPGERRVPEVPGYEVGDVLGAGGMGVVWRARRLADGVPVALKVLDVGSSDRSSLGQRFAREFEVMNSLVDPGLPRAYGGGVLPSTGDPWVAMELLDGCTLGDHPGYGRLGAADLDRVARSLLATLSLVHERGIVHRDLKPGNVFLTRDGRVVLLDFGLAFLDERTRLTTTGNVTGTVLTMAPEQLAGAVPEARTDLWGLGATLTLAAAGRSPCSLDELVALARDDAAVVVRSLGLARPDLPEAFVDLVDRCCAPCPEGRPSSAAEALGLLTSAGGHGSRRGRFPWPSPPARPSQVPSRGMATVVLAPVPSGRRRAFPALMAIGVLATAVLAAAVGADLWQSRGPTGEGTVDREALVLRLLADPWPPSQEGVLTALARVVEARGEVPGAWRGRTGAPEAAALLAVAREGRRRGMASRAWAVSSTLLQRHGELVASFDEPDTLAACVADAAAAGDRAGLAVKLRDLRERCPGRDVGRVSTALATALVDWYRNERQGGSSGLESSGRDVDVRLTESFELLRPLIFAASPDAVTSAVLEPWLAVLDWSNSPTTKRAHMALSSMWSATGKGSAADAILLRLYEGAEQRLWVSEGGPGGDSVTADFELALVHLGRALDLAGSGQPMRSRRILLRQARTLIEMGRRDDARVVYAKAQAISLVSDAQEEGFDLEDHLDADAVVARRLGLTDIALARLRALTELDLPESRRCRHLRDLAVFCAKKGMLQEALVAADEALPLTTDPERRRELAEMRRLWKMGDTLFFGAE